MPFFCKQKSIFFRTAYRPAAKPLLLTFFTSLLSSRTLQPPFNSHSTTIQGVLPDLLAKTHSLLSNSFLLDLQSSLPTLISSTSNATRPSESYRLPPVRLGVSLRMSMKPKSGFIRRIRNPLSSSTACAIFILLLIHVPTRRHLSHPSTRGLRG